VTESSRSRSYPSLTIVVATFNSASKSWLKKSLESITSQRYPGSFELLVADGGSTDETISICAAAGARVIPNPQVTELGYSGGKNLAASQARGSLIGFVDADNVLMEPDYLRNMVFPFTMDKSVVMSVPSPYIPPPKEWPGICRYFTIVESDYWKTLTSRGERREGWIRFRPLSIVVSNGAILDRDILEKIGGWDYDTEVGEKLLRDSANTFAFVPIAHRFHIEVVSYREVWRKLRRRAIHHFDHIEERPVVQSQLESARLDPAAFLRNELAVPLAKAVDCHQWTYLHSLPIFGLKSAILLTQGGRRVWSPR
jgi:glycosyltransferase involved in cell wall biosynthesis